MSTASKTVVRSGFTLIELLVVVAIIGVLMALLLMAVQAAREAGRRTQCANNFRQLGIALHNYHDQHNVFPPALINSGRFNPDLLTLDGRRVPWGRGQKVLNHTGFTLLLPYLEQGALYDQWDFSLPSSSATRPGAYPIAGQESARPWEYGRAQLVDKSQLNNFDYKDFLFSTYLSVYHCPSDVKPDRWTFEERGPTFRFAAQSLRRSNYLFGSGWTEDSVYDYHHADHEATWMHTEPRNKLYEFQGMFGNNGAAEMSMVKDGLSNSVAMGESVQQKASPRWGPFWGAGLHTCCHGFVDMRDRACGPSYTHINGKCRMFTTKEGKCTRGQWTRCVWAWVFSSYHPGGAQFVMGDGSVKFLSEKMNTRTFRLMNFIHDGNPVAFEN